MEDYRGLCKAGLATIEEIPFHVCRELTIIYLLDNDLKMTTVAGAQVLYVGQAEILNVKEPVMLEAVSGACQIVYFAFDRFYTESASDNFDRITYNCNICNFFGSAAKPELIRKLTLMMLRLSLDMANDQSRFAVKDAADQLLSYIRENFDDVAHAFAESARLDVSRERFQRISEYMIAHVEEKMSLNEIAQNEYLSIPYLSKEFSDKLEKSYRAILNYYRTINAAIQLLDTEDSLTCIAENSGFSSIRYYNKVFSDYLSCLPSKFRSEYKKKAWKCSRKNLDRKRLLEEIEKIEKTGKEGGEHGHCDLPVTGKVSKVFLCSESAGEVETLFTVEAARQCKLIVMEIKDDRYRKAKQAAKFLKLSPQQIPAIDPKKEYLLLSEEEQQFKLVMHGPWEAEIYILLFDRS